jgi:hypothetical protein
MRIMQAELESGRMAGLLPRILLPDLMFWAMATMYCGIVTKEARQQVGLEVGSIVVFYVLEVC